MSMLLNWILVLFRIVVGWPFLLLCRASLSFMWYWNGIQKRCRNSSEYVLPDIVKRPRSEKNLWSQSHCSQLTMILLFRSMSLILWRIHILNDVLELVRRLETHQGNRWDYVTTMSELVDGWFLMLCSNSFSRAVLMCYWWIQMESFAAWKELTYRSNLEKRTERNYVASFAGH